MNSKAVKPLKKKCYGSIPHLPLSKRGEADKGLEISNARYLTTDLKKLSGTNLGLAVHVHEKLDGSCVGVWNNKGELVPLLRSGYEAAGSRYKQHHIFHAWVMDNAERFLEALQDGERICGEWLLETHGTVYNLPHEPFVVFDVINNEERLLKVEVDKRCKAGGFIRPRLIHSGPPISVSEVLKKLEPGGHGNVDPVEGAVWRLENDFAVGLLGKYVRPDSCPGRYFEHLNEGVVLYNTHPGVPLIETYRHLLG